MPRVIVTAPGKVPQPYRFAMDREKIRIGRGSENDIVLDARSVSTYHAEIERTDSSYVLRDLGSTNGIKINDQIRDTIDLAEPGQMWIGDVELTFELTDEEIASLDAEHPHLPDLPDAPLGEIPEPPATHWHRESREGSRFGLGAIIALCLLAVLGVLAGVGLRHYQMTGRNIVTEILSNLDQAPEASADPGDPVE